MAKKNYKSGGKKSSAADILYELDATDKILEQSEDLVLSGEYNTGFTYVNPLLKEAVIVIGPTTDGSEFINTVVHELYHLAVSIAAYLGEDVYGEVPAYMAGDSIEKLADLVCNLGCTP